MTPIGFGEDFDHAKVPPSAVRTTRRSATDWVTLVLGRVGCLRTVTAYCRSKVNSFGPSTVTSIVNGVVFSSP